MAPKASVGYPWILDGIAKYEGGNLEMKAAPAQVVEFLKMPDRTEDCQYPGAVILISDRKYYIRAIVTKEAKETMEREDEHFTFDRIKNKIVILRKFTLSFAAEEDLRCCEFYLTIHHFTILAMETNTVDLLNSNMDPGVRWKRKDLWQKHMEELKIQQAVLDMNSSDVSLTQLLMIANDEKLSALKSVAEQCLELDVSATQDLPPQVTTRWSTEMRNHKNSTSSFSIPINTLQIPPEEEAALEQMSEFRLVNSNSDDDDSSENSLVYSTAVSTLSTEPMDDGESQPENPWNNLPSICVSSTSDCSHPNTQLSCDKDPRAHSEVPPAINKYHEDESSSESPDETPALSFNLASNPTVAQTKSCTASHLTALSSSNTDLPYSNGNRSNSNQLLLSKVPPASNSQKECSSVVYSSSDMASKVPISPTLTPSSESDGESRPKSGRSKEGYRTPTARKSVKRKQVPDELDTTSPDIQQPVPGYMERLNCVASGPVCERTILVHDRHNKFQSEINEQVAERCRTAHDSCVEREVVEQTVNTCGTPPARKRAPPYKPSLEFLVKTKTKSANGSENAAPATDVSTTSSPCPKRASPNGFASRTSALYAPVVEGATTEMVHSDGTSFRYKYEPPSADLCACMQSLQIPVELCGWARKILSEVKGSVL